MVRPHAHFVRAFVPTPFHAGRICDRPFSRKELDDCKAKVDFVETAIRQEHDFEQADPTDPEICMIVDWLSNRSAAEVASFACHVTLVGPLCLPG